MTESPSTERSHNLVTWWSKERKHREGLYLICCWELKTVHKLKAIIPKVFSWPDWYRRSRGRRRLPAQRWASFLPTSLPGWGRNRPAALEHPALWRGSWRSSGLVYEGSGAACDCRKQKGRWKVIWWSAQVFVLFKVLCVSFFIPFVTKRRQGVRWDFIIAIKRHSLSVDSVLEIEHMEQIFNTSFSFLDFHYYYYH